MARPIVLILHLFRLADAIKFKKGLFTPPIVRHLDPIVGITGCVSWPTGLNLVTLLSLFMSIKDHSLLWMVIRSQTYYPEYILAYGSGKAHCSLVVGSGSF